MAQCQKVKRREHVVIALIGSISLKEQQQKNRIIKKEPKDLMLFGKREDIILLLPFVARRFCCSVSCLSGPLILAIAKLPTPNR